MNLAAWLWTDSIRDMSLSVCGAQMTQVLSIDDLLLQFALTDGEQLILEIVL